jgi:hypothetical protein
MQETLQAADGHRLAAYRAAPSGKPRGALVVMQEIFGVNSHIRRSPTAMPPTAGSPSRRRCSTASSAASRSATRRPTSNAGAS